MDVKEKIALVTGGAKRVGRGIALALAGKGAHILLHYHTSKLEAEKTAGDVRSLGVRCDLFQADLGSTDQVLSMAQNVLKQFPSIHILVNSASLFYKTPFKDVSESDWDRLLDTNLKGPFTLSRKIGNHMAAHEGGKIINIADWSGSRPYKDYAPYCASKGGLITLTKSLARDLAPKVQANAVAPGPVLLPAGFPENEKEEILKKIPLGRLGTPRDVASAVLFLVENDFINGTVLVVDGGRSLV
ncbi:MAG: SDR family oxidoreductase [Candidatus Omnitrophica bacterium]|nr:SDR family oxidoreductase [Candidatus Omnitrophota bacterium]